MDLLRVHKGFVLISVVFLTDGDAGQRRPLLPQICDNFSSVDSSNRTYPFPSTPLPQAFDRSPVTIFLGDIRHHHPNRVDMGRLKVSQQTVLIAF